MKKIVLALILIVSLSMVSAQQLPDVAVTPDHPLYDSKTSVENMIEDLAPNETERAKAKLEQAEKRLAETERMTEQNRTELANKTAESYSKEMEELQGFGERAGDLAEQREIEQLVAEATEFHTEVLARVYEKVPEEARAGIEKAMNRSVTGHQLALKSLNETGGIPEGVGNKDVEGMVPEGVQGDMGIPSGANNTIGGNVP